MKRPKCNTCRAAITSSFTRRDAVIARAVAELRQYPPLSYILHEQMDSVSAHSEEAAGRSYRISAASITRAGIGPTCDLSKIRASFGKASERRARKIVDFCKLRQRATGISVD